MDSSRNVHNQFRRLWNTIYNVDRFRCQNVMDKYRGRFQLTSTNAADGITVYAKHALPYSISYKPYAFLLTSVGCSHHVRSMRPVLTKFMSLNHWNYCNVQFVNQNYS